MTDRARRQFLKLAGAGSAMAAFPPSIQRALAAEAARGAGTIADVQHVVILMLENRAFDHYFGSFRGVRGFADRHPVPLPGSRDVWAQSDGHGPVAPFHLDAETTSALKVHSTPHGFGNAQGAWGQGRMEAWPRFKTPLSMGHYQRSDIPFQFALAEAFTLCDAYHCSVTTGTDPNRIAFWSGANFDPEKRRRGENCTEADAEPDNLRCWIKGALPEPGYAYQGSALTWPTIPQVLQTAGVSWRIYQDPNDNWTGAMHGGLAFEAFRAARPGSPLYENGMRHWSLERLESDVRSGQLPQVSWILPSQAWSEHPAGSSPMQGAEFTSRVLDALTADSEVWGRTALFLCFDENDGFFDHVPPPAPPSYELDGRLAGAATLPLEGMYFSDPERKHLDPRDQVSGTVRPWGLGPRVPMYVISPWSRGGWVNSQVFDHTSVGQFIETRFGVSIPAISPWHRAVCGDLTSCFDFSGREAKVFPRLPRVANVAALAAAAEAKPPPAPPATPQPLFQEPGFRASRALPYRLEVDAAIAPDGRRLRLSFRNDGTAGAVFHVYDRRHLDRIPRRYTVEAGRTLDGLWDLTDDGGRYDLWIYGPNGFVREAVGQGDGAASRLEAVLRYDVPARMLRLAVINPGAAPAEFTVRAGAYGAEAPWRGQAAAGGRVERAMPLHKRHNWYDVAVAAEGFQRRFAGRLENGRHDISDPAV
ncbi:phosphocholine-specific phospholipase C [Phenylobacterium sp.]|uniref:phosphocholine-specific phospholipase C n=1 Tax=Phenylobacterium sp. TaxID=1871053 RepID=UPI00121A3EFA|nr:phospholipase C, phosphocholine-specific [Phenylobacterium sp.]THD61409.1 MAG: phospholipase C, phosphocholine-specific [Phenylobacterium sp.]